ncbi:MAG: hypothetical protein ACKVKG_05455 [Alphaproteobacteria bacterium]|jgi:hypothetical protein
MRKIINIALAAMLFCLIGAERTARAQTDVSQVVFTEIEKRAIKRFYESIGLRNPENSGRVGQGQHSSQKSEKRKSRKHWKHKSGKKKKFKHGKGKSKQTPPGLARRNQLPAGLAKRKALPPGLAKRRLPSNLESQLAPLPIGVERVLVGDDVVLIQKGTNLLLDVLENILNK